MAKPISIEVVGSDAGLRKAMRQLLYYCTEHVGQFKVNSTLTARGREHYTVLCEQIDPAFIDGIGRIDKPDDVEMTLTVL